MSIVAIRCLRCGGPTVPTANPNEYNCQHCGFVSEFVRPADGTVVRTPERIIVLFAGEPLNSYDRSGVQSAEPWISANTAFLRYLTLELNGLFVEPA